MRFDPDIEIVCDGGVYEPAEDSRMMVESVEVEPGDRVFEVGCGSGIVALHCAKAGADVTASDISPEAVLCARDNASRNKLKIRAAEGDMMEAASGEYDVIIFNPPYLPEGGADDPRWTGGRSGIEAAIRFLEQCGRHLAVGGRVYTIASSLAGRREFEEAAERLGYDRRIVNEKRIFFEELAVYELTPRSDG
jgi:release factor glutamine methyltransferase